MRLSISEMAELSGVSVRTLHYYDQIGLLRPDEVSEENGYRWYGTEAAKRLQQILFYRELDFPLKEIAEILSASEYDAQEAMRKQQELLLLKRQRLDRLLALLTDNLKGERTMEFSGFSTEELKQKRAEYAAEAKERWGDTAAWQESSQHAAGRSEKENTAMDEKMNECFHRFAAVRYEDPTGEAAHAAVADWQAFLTENYYNCTKEILAGLGQMYSADERFRDNLDRFGQGTAAFMSAAIEAYCK
jgi:DNA-binding transcriptional MerR regulator